MPHFHKALGIFSLYLHTYQHLVFTHISPSPKSTLAWLGEVNVVVTDTGILE